MNTYRRNRRITRFHVALVTSLVAIISLLGSLGPSVSAQVMPSSQLATQFFLSLAGTPTTYALSADALLHTPQGDYVGQAGPGEFYTDLAASFSHLSFQIGDAAQNGDRVIVSFTMTGINTGSWHGLAANCAGITVDGVAILKTNQETISLEEINSNRADETIEQTVVVEQWISFDEAQITSQISAVNLMDPQDRPGCAEHVLFQNDQDSPNPGYEPAPACNAAAQCRLPY